MAASLLLSVIILAVYLYDVLHLVNAGQLSQSALMGAVVKMVLLSLILEVVTHSVLAGLNAKEADRGDDERDKLIALKSNRWAYAVLTSAVYISIFFIWLNSVAPERAVQTPFIFDDIEFVYSILHLLLSGFICAEITRYGTRLIYYRRGA
ncbi:hypothetical protein [Aestuariibacter salexigens]|uniref:hypothetical protein n=1 Tax=Aestuariibacter salexigens TaxID=226010 RepID=UPI0012EB4F3A|nr:hypothetical protein [Aestuariibacter salexigens]